MASLQQRTDIQYDKAAPRIQLRTHTHCLLTVSFTAKNQEIAPLSSLPYVVFCSCVNECKCNFSLFFLKGCFSPFTRRNYVQFDFNTMTPQTVLQQIRSQFKEHTTNKPHITSAAPLYLFIFFNLTHYFIFDLII